MVVATVSAVFAAALLCVLPVACQAVDSNAQSGPLNDTYPYHPHKGQRIEYSSAVVNQPGDTLGLTDPKDGPWLNWLKNASLDFNPEDPYVSRWIPPRDGKEVETRTSNGLTEFTNIYCNTCEYPMTQLWYEDKFWAPACSRMTLELQRHLSASQASGTKVTSIKAMVKHYGNGFPDKNGVADEVWTYVVAMIMSVGSSPISSFASACPHWFGDLAAQAQDARFPDSGRTLVDVTVNGRTLLDADQKPVQVPPRLIRATVGGTKAIQAGDGSNFTLWISPSYSFES